MNILNGIYRGLTLFAVIGVLILVRLQNGTGDGAANDLAPAGRIVRASLGLNGEEANQGSAIDGFQDTSISADGRFVAFASWASNLVVGDANRTADVFVYDRQTGQTERISTSSEGGEGNGASGLPAISADGRWVAFTSLASNLTVDDTNGVLDVFVHDRHTRITERISLGFNGLEADAASAEPAISGDGRFVAFESRAGNLVAGDGNNVVDIFRYDRQMRRMQRVSVAVNGEEARQDSWNPSISGNGQVVAFESLASNLTGVDTGDPYLDVFVHNIGSGRMVQVSTPLITGVNGELELGSHNSKEPALSADGRFVAFTSMASNLVAEDANGMWSDVFVHDLHTGQTDRIGPAVDGEQAILASNEPAVSEDGRFVTFVSLAPDLADPGPNLFSVIFLFDRQTRQMRLVSSASNGSPADQESWNPAIASDGRTIVFASSAANLVERDTNWLPDIFVFQRESP